MCNGHLNASIDTWGVTPSHPKCGKWIEVQVCKIDTFFSSSPLPFLGVDLLFTSDGANVKPFVLGFHPSLCLLHSYPDQERVMESARDREIEACRGTLLLTPLIRSQRYLMQRKTVRVIGAGGHSKRFIWEAANHYQIKVSDHPNKQTVHPQMPNQEIQEVTNPLFVQTAK